MKCNINRHHNWWEGRHYKQNSILTKLRNHHGFIIPMDIYDHRELHAGLAPPPRPTKQEAEGLLDYIGGYDSMAERIDYLDMAIDYFEVSRSSLAGHLLRQRDYVLLNPMTATERDIVEMEREQPRLIVPVMAA